MPPLTKDDTLLQLPTLSSVHIDAIRCIYDERLNRVKDLLDKPVEQLTYFQEISDDAFSFWEAIQDYPEARPNVREDFKQAMSGFFDRVIRYAEFHDDASLSKGAQEQKGTLIADVKAKIKKLDAPPPKPAVM
jgi:hypothetical protein